jgi:ABC-2 type transport system ATP-binding protein
VSAADTVLTPPARKHVRDGARQQRERNGAREREDLRMLHATIEVNRLRKRFGPVVALDGLTFTVRPGLVTGFVGPNGAGKSTTMRVILGLDSADEGAALVGGRPYRSLHRPLSHLGSLLDAAALQPSRSARNHLLWLAHSQGLTASRVDAVIEQAGLRSAARRKAGGYSLGMRQRLGIAAAMLGDPPVLMMDEPFNGMDPEGIIWMRGFLRTLAAQGRAILVSSHLMSELEDIADHLVILGRGKVIADAGTGELLAAASGDRVSVGTTAAPEAAAVLERAGATVVAGRRGAVAGTATVGTAATGLRTLTVSGLTAEQVVQVLTAKAVPFSEISAHRATLEQAYLDLTRDAAEFRAAPTAPAAPSADSSGRSDSALSNFASSDAASSDSAPASRETAR